MKNRKTALALALFLCLSLFLSACGASGASTNSSQAAGENFVPSVSSAPEAPMEYEPGEWSPADNNGVFPGDAPSGGGYYDNTKVIRTADLRLQSTDFDGAVEALDALVSAQNGYYESTDFSYGGYYGGGNRWASFTIRVPKENFNSFMDAVGNVAHLVDSNTGTEDVGALYYDAELHLATLKTKHERLLALLDRAELMEDIIALESALTDVEYQIQQYTSTLTRYDGLIDFSTIHLNLQEVARVTETATEADPLSDRLSVAFSRGWHNFCDNMADFAVWMAYNFTGVIVFLIIAAVVIVALVRQRKRHSRRFTPPEPPKDSNDSNDPS